MSENNHNVTADAVSVSPSKAAAILGCGRTRIYQLLKKGELLSYREGAARRIITSSIYAYVERQIEAHASSPKWSSTAKATEASVSRRSPKPIKA